MPSIFIVREILIKTTNLLSRIKWHKRKNIYILKRSMKFAILFFFFFV